MASTTVDEWLNTKAENSRQEQTIAPNKKPTREKEQQELNNR